MYTKKLLKRTKYTWGKLVRIYEIENYLIVSYYSNKYINGTHIDNEFESELSFHPYVNGRDTHHSFSSLDMALIHAICYSSGHHRASEFINNMLSFKNE